MAKEMEGKYYYYSPQRYSVELYQIYSRNGSIDPIVVGLDQKNASLIVDALNYMHSSTRVPLDELYKESENGTAQSTN